MQEEDPAALALALETARGVHAQLVASIQRRMRELDALWRTAKPADRLLAVQRLIQANALPAKVNRELEAKNERVRETMSLARTERRKLERLVQEGSETRETSGLRHSMLRLELDAQHAEQERDEFLDEQDLRGPLYFCGETFVRSEPFSPDESSLKDLAPRAKALEERVIDLQERVPRKGARFMTRTDDGSEKTLIRLLPALTMDTEPAS